MEKEESKGTGDSKVEAQNPQFIRFLIPLLPPSMNDIYYHIKGHFGEYQYVLKPEVRLWKTQAKEYVPTFKPNPHHPTGLFYFNWVAVGDFYYKNGKVRRRDLTNLEKVLIDAVCEKLGVGDEFIWSTQRTKRHDEKKSHIEAEFGYLSHEGD